jgi:hypothetical protein
MIKIINNMKQNKELKDFMLEALNRLDDWASQTTQDNNNGEAEQQTKDYTLLFNFIQSK